MKFIHCSDLHLTAEPESGKPWAQARKNAIWSTAEKIVDDCISGDIDLLLIAGDLFHRQPSMADLKRLGAIFERMKKTQVVIIAGDYDYIGPRSNYLKYKWPKNVHMIDTRDISEHYIYGTDTTVYGLSYMASEITAPLYRDAKPKKSSGIHILLAYGGEMNKVPIDYEELSVAGFDYVALGHEHNFREAGYHMYYPGTPEPLDPSETGEHGYILGEFKYENGKYVLTTDFVPVAKSRYIDLHVRAGASDTNQSVIGYLTREILKNGAGNLYRVYIEGIRGENVVFDREAIAEIGLITEVVDNTVLNYNYEELLAQNPDNIIGAFMNNLMEEEADETIKNRALYYGIDALIKASDMK